MQKQPTTKCCLKCGIVKPIEDFDHTKRGISGQCKDCRRAYMRERARLERERHPERGRSRALACYHRNRDEYRRRQNERQRVQPPEHLTCKQCKSTKPVHEFKRHNAKGTRYTLICNACFNPLANVRRRKARLKAAPGEFNSYHLRMKLELQGGRCYYCRADLLGERHIEHKIPVSRGGSNWPANIALACRRCNLQKHDKTPMEYRAYLAALS